MKTLVRESCVEVVKIEFSMQKVEISVKESCVELDKHRKGCAPPSLKGPSLFLKIHITLHQDKKFFFCQPR
jgi:hypothetical protein